MYTATSVSPVEISENAKTKHAAFSDEMNALCYVYNTDSRQLTESHEMGTGDYLLGNEGLLLADPPYTGQQRAIKGTANLTYSPGSGVSSMVSTFA